MSSRKPEKAKSKSGRKKLTLSKETLKDLTAKGQVKGGVSAGCTDGCKTMRGQCGPSF